ncbi:MAG: LptA/OstA family protein [Alphaproteobacteria bacterium]
MKKNYLYPFFLLIFAHLPSYGAMNLFSPEGGIPIDITSDNGIEIDRTNKVIVATGNAKVVREATTLYADKLYAFYEEDAEGNTVFWRLDAEGNFKITADQGQITGENGTYDVRQEIVVIKGNPVVVKGEQGTVVAHKQIEYYDTERRIIARGQVKGTQGDQSIEAEVVEVFLKPDSANNTDPTAKAASDVSSLASDVDQIRAYTDITLKNKDGTVTGDRAIWFADTEQATLTGDVTLKQLNNVLNGCRAEVNTASGSARLIGGACSEDDGISGRFESKQ